MKSLSGIPVFMAPLENNKDKFSENINFIIEDLGGQDITLADYAKITKQQLEQYIEDYVFENEAFATAGNGKEYFNLIYKGKGEGGKKLKWLQSITISSGKAYVVSYTAEENSFDKFFDQAREIAASWTYE